MCVCQAMKVSGHVCVSSNESERSCMCVKGIDRSRFYDFHIGFWNCSHFVVFFVFCFVFVFF